MKKMYENILTLNESGYTVQVNRNMKYFIIKIGKSSMNNYDRKAETIKCDNLKDLKNTLSILSEKNGLNTLNYICDKKNSAFDTAMMFMEFIKKEM